MKLALKVVWDIDPISINQSPPSKDRKSIIMPLGVVVHGPAGAKGEKGDQGDAMQWSTTNW